MLTSSKDYFVIDCRTKGTNMKQRRFRYKKLGTALKAAGIKNRFVTRAAAEKALASLGLPKWAVTNECFDLYF